MNYSVPERWLEVKEAEGDQVKRIPLEYEAGGADTTSLAAGPGGNVYVSTCHPMHLVRLETATGVLHDLGPIPRVGGGNFCAMDSLGNQLFGAAYAHGGLWAYDPAQPWKPASKVNEPGNPRLLAEWQKDVCRPRTALAHPDGKHVLFAGFADYGYTGGGIGIVNVQTGEATLLTADKDLLPGHSTITLKALPDGTLVGGTSIQAPGGGHVIATQPELYLLDWQTKKVIHRAPVVPDGGDIISIHVGPDGLVYGLTAKSAFFVFDPRSRKVVHQESFAEHGGVPRHALQIGPDGKVYAMLTRAILRIAPGSFAHEKRAEAPVTITAGGALVNGHLYFTSGPRVWISRARVALTKCTLPCYTWRPRVAHRTPFHAVSSLPAIRCPSRGSYTVRDSHGQAPPRGRRACRRGRMPMGARHLATARGPDRKSGTHRVSDSGAASSASCPDTAPDPLISR